MESIQQEGLEEKADEVAEKRQKEAKPLNSVERRALGKLVDGDFDALKLEMTQLAEDVKRGREIEIKAEFADKERMLESFKDSLHRLKRDFRREWDEIRRAAGEQGITTSGETREIFYYFDPSFSIAGLQEAINSMHREVQRDLQRAINTLERKRIETQRKVLLTGIVSENAMEVLESLPDARTLMLEAAQSETTRQALEASRE